MDEERQIRERFDLTIERIRSIGTEETAAPVYRDYFQKTAKFLLKLHETWNRVCSRKIKECTLTELQKENAELYEDIVGEHYAVSYANPTYAVSVMGSEIGRFLSVLYTELRGEIAYVYEGKLLYLTICNELFIEVYNCFE